MNDKNASAPDDPNRDRDTGGERPFGQSGQSGRPSGRDRFEESLADTWDAPDASVDRRLRELVGPVTPMIPPPYGFERVVMKARRRRNRTAFTTAAVFVLIVAVAGGGVLLGMHLGRGNGTLQVAGCDTVGRAAPGAGSVAGQQVNYADAADVVNAADPARAGGPSGIGSWGEVMDRKYEWAIGGVLTAAALSAGIVAGCSSNTANNGPTASGTQSGTPTPDQSPGQVNLQPAPSGTSSPTDGSSSTASGLPRCHTADLSPAVNIVAGSQGAGHESINIKLTNTSGHDCTVYGYPGMKLEDGNGSGQATTVTRNRSLKPATLTVANGGSVATTGRFDFDVPASDEPQTGNCEAPSVYLEITPPDETTQLSATITGGPVTVCEHGTIDVLPFIAGSTGPNQ